MPYIAREDGEHFVIPSYRDVLSAKNKGQLKKDIHLLSQSYGEYITLQKKNAMQYEIAFSPDTGYLLGETVWQHFNKPDDMIYCEAIPGSAEVIMVIVKDSSVYLDGSFPTENVSEELVVFLTQQAHFDIYTYGDVPIADSPEDGKFSFDAKSVKTFTRLDNPVFPTLPLIPAYKLQLVDVALKAHGIGVVPIIPIVAVAIIAGLGWYLFGTSSEPEQVQVVEQVVNPYDGYINTMHSPLPNEEVMKFVAELKKLLLLPGWVITEVTYSGGQLTAKVLSSGATVESLYDWAKKNNVKVILDKATFSITDTITLTVADRSKTIHSLDDTIAILLDRLNKVYLGNHVSVGEVEDNQVFKKMDIGVSLENFAPLFIELMAKQFKNLPLVVKDIKGSVENGRFKGVISLTVLGN